MGQLMRCAQRRFLGRNRSTATAKRPPLSSSDACRAPIAVGPVLNCGHDKPPRHLDSAQKFNRCCVTATLHDPAAAPYGGECILELMRRVANWLTEEKAQDRRSVAITLRMRAMIVDVMDAPPKSFWCVDIGALSVTHLSSSGGAWKIRSSGCTLRL
jgi:hypothetical protein